MFCVYVRNSRSGKWLQIFSNSEQQKGEIAFVLSSSFFNERKFIRCEEIAPSVVDNDFFEKVEIIGGGK